MADITRIDRQRLNNVAKRGQSQRTENAEVPATPIDRDQLVACMELLFFAYRDFTGDPDTVLARYSFGRAHHRVVHFVNRNPGLSVADLLLILKITKQSLARVLKQLIEQGFVVQKTGKEDKRQRLLFATAKGTRLAEKLAELQISRLEQAFQAAGTSSHEATRRFLLAMVGSTDRESVENLINSPAPKAKASTKS